MDTADRATTAVALAIIAACLWELWTLPPCEPPTPPAQEYSRHEACDTDTDCAEQHPDHTDAGAPEPR